RRLLSTVVAGPAAHAARARRQLAALLAARGNRTEALDLLSVNTRDHGVITADERVRFYVDGQDATQLPRVLAKFQDSLTQQPPTATERLLLAELCITAGKPSQARAALQPLAIQAAPTPQHVARYIQALIRAGDLDEAAPLLAPLER